MGGIAIVALGGVLHGIPGYVRSLVDTWSRSGKAPLDSSFPLENGTTDTLRVLPGLRADVVVSWMDPITGLPGGPRFGANNDYIAWFADGWDADWTGGIVGSAPRFNGSAKIGASELNRPEDVEWNPASRRLFPALTKHGRKVGLKQNGTLARTASGSTVETARRVDDVGSIWTLVESNPDNPAVSDSFSFWPVWFGSRGDGTFDAASPDDLLIDRDGGLIVARTGPSA